MGELYCCILTHHHTWSLLHRLFPLPLIRFSRPLMEERDDTSHRDATHTTQQIVSGRRNMLCVCVCVCSALPSSPPPSFSSAHPLHLSASSAAAATRPGRLSPPHPPSCVATTYQYDGTIIYWLSERTHLSQHLFYVRQRRDESDSSHGDEDASCRSTRARSFTC